MFIIKIVTCLQVEWPNDWRDELRVERSRFESWRVSPLRSTGTDELSGKLVSRGNNNTPCCVVIEIGISSG